MISIGLLSYQRTDLLLQTVSDIVKTSYEVELILVNNNEDKCILQDVKRVIDNKKNIKLNYVSDAVNYGVSIGRNIIVNKCTNEFLILFDDDVSIDNIDCIISSTIKELSNASIGGLAFNIKEYQTNTHNRFEIPHKNKNISMDDNFLTYLMIGAGHAINVKYAIEVGNYPLDFGMYGFEEVDLSFRLINSGYKIKYISNCLVHHKKSPDGRFSNERVNYLAFRNRLLMAKRYFSMPYIISCFFVRGVFFLIKQKNLNLYLKAVREVANDSHENKFSKKFYDYIKSVNGFIYW